jgi:hypothetical protein
MMPFGPEVNVGGVRLWRFVRLIGCVPYRIELMSAAAVVGVGVGVVGVGVGVVGVGVGATPRSPAVSV